MDTAGQDQDTCMPHPDGASARMYRIFAHMLRNKATRMHAQIVRMKVHRWPNTANFASAGWRRAHHARGKTQGERRGREGRGRGRRKGGEMNSISTCTVIIPRVAGGIVGSMPGGPHSSATTCSRAFLGKHQRERHSWGTKHEPADSVSRRIVPVDAGLT